MAAVADSDLKGKTKRRAWKKPLTRRPVEEILRGVDKEQKRVETGQKKWKLGNVTLT